MGKKLRIIAGLISVTVVVAGAAVTVAKDNATYERDVKKIIAGHCLSCHGSDAPTIGAFKKDRAGFKRTMQGPRMDSYANLMIFVNGSDTGALMRRLDDGKNTKDGKPGNMYRHLGGTERERAENLRVLQDWVGGWTLKRKADITEEERKAITAREQ